MRKRPLPQIPRLRRAASLSRGGRWAVRACLVAPTLVFLAAAALYCVRLGGLLRANLSPIVAAEVTRQTGHETRVGAIRLLPLGVVTVDNVALSSRATFRESHGESVLKADRLTVHYNLRGLLFDSGNAAHALGDVRLDRPTLLVERLSKTQFNFSDILKPPTRPRAKPFVGQILVRDGTLRFRDYLAPAGLGIRPALNTLTRVSATINLHSERMAYFTADGLGADHRLNTFSVRGDASRLIAGRFRVSADVANVDAAYWSSYFAALPQARVTSGRADLDLTVARLGSRPPPGLPVDLLGRIAVRHGAVRLTAPALRRLIVQGIAGSADFTGGGVAFDADASVNGQPVAASGTLSDFAHPQLAATATVAALDAEPLVRAVPQVSWPSGLRLAPITATVSAVGAASQPTLSASIAVPSLQYQGNRLVALRASLVFAAKTLSIPRLSFGTPGGGQALLHGTVEAGGGRPPQVRLAGQAAGLNLAALHLPGAAKLNLGGRADAQFLADSVGRPLRVVADVAIARPRVSRTQLLSARARLVYVAGRGLTVSRGLVRAAQGAALAAGTVPVGRSGPWDLRLDAAGLDLASLVGPYAKVPVGGLAYFQGRVSGPGAAPRVAGQVQLLNPRYARFAADVVRGGLAASATGLRLDNLTLDRFPTAAAVSGSVTRLASGDPALGLRVRVSQADVQDFLNLADQLAPPARPVPAGALPPITGTAAGTFQVGGTARDPRISGQAAVTDATVGDYRVDSLRLRGSYHTGTVRLADAALQGEGATLSAHGVLTLKTGRVRAAFAVHGVDLERLRALTDTYADLDGVVAASGLVGGSLKSPTVAATVTADGLTVNRQEFAPLALSGRYADGEFTKTGAPWALSLVPTSPSGPDTEYIVNALRLALPTPQRPRLVPSLYLDAAVPSAAPETIPHLIQTLRDSRFAGTPSVARLLTQIAALPSPLGGTLAVPRLVVQGPLAGPSVRATVQASGVTLGANTLGSLTADVTYADPKDPRAALSLTAKGLVAAGVPVDSLTAQASLANHLLTLADLRATSRSAYLEASGRADLRAGGALDASLDASNIPLALLDPLLPQPAVERRSLTGQIGSLTVSASGPTAAPNLTASVSLADPGLAVGTPGRPPRAAYSLERVRSGAITLTTPSPGAAQVLTITDLAAFQNGRPVASLSGSLPFEWRGQGVAGAAGQYALAGLPGGQPLHAQLTVQDLSQLAPFLPALDPKRTAGTLTADLDVTDTGNGSRLRGSLELTGGALGLASFDTALDKIQAHVTLDGDRLSIGHLSADSTKGGTLSVTGGGTLAGADSVRVTADNLTVDESSRQTLLAKTYGSAFRGKLSGSLDIAGPWLTPGIRTAPGAPLVVSDANGTIPSAPSAAGGPAPQPAFDPSLDMTVLLGAPNRPVSVGNALLRADASGDVHLTGSLSSPMLRAHLNIVRGQFYLPPATRLKFVRSGQGNIVDLRYPVPAADGSGQPSLQTLVDLTAQTTVSYSQAEMAANQSAIPTAGVGAESMPLLGSPALGATAFNQPQSYTITAHIHGYLNDPNLPIDLESSPPGLSRQQMLAALTGVAGLQGLTGPNSQGAFQQELTSAIYQGFVPSLLTPLEENIANSLNLTEFDVAYSPDAPVVVTLSKLVAPRLEVTYIRSIGTRNSQPSVLVEPPQYTVKLSYGLTRRFQISVSTDDQNNNTIALEGVAGF